MSEEEKVEVVREYLEGIGEAFMTYPPATLYCVPLLTTLIKMSDKDVASFIRRGAKIRATQKGEVA